AGRTRIRPAPPAGEQPAVAVEDADPSPGRVRGRRRRPRPHPRTEAQLRDVHATDGVDEHLAGPRNVGPFLEECAVGAEELEAAVLAVGHDDRAVGPHGDPVRQPELTGRPPGSPHEERWMPLGEYRWTRALPYPSAMYNEPSGANARLVG